MPTDAEEDIDYSNDGQPHYMLTVIDMAATGHLSPERATNPDLAGERMLVCRCLDSYFGPEFRHVDLDLMIGMSHRIRDEIMGAMPALLWALRWYASRNSERAPTHLILDGRTISMEEAVGLWPPLEG